jgi:hypothetical protein
LLAHLHVRRFPFAPQAFGFDAQGREILSYVPGETVGASLPWPEWVWDEALLAQIGQATARYHKAVADFRPAGLRPWRFGAAELGSDEIVCHHDLAPYNVVVLDGELQGIIDWDLIAPGTVRSELAFVAWQWVPLQHPVITDHFGCPSRDLGRRLRILLDAYGLPDRAGFVDDVMARVRLNRDVMRRKAAEGDPAYVRLEREGHVRGMNMALDFLTVAGVALQAQLG